MAAVVASLIGCFLFFSISLAAKDAFHEEMFIRPLKTGHVYAHFQFTTIWDVDIRDSKACKLKSLSNKLIHWLVRLKPLNIMFRLKLL